LALRKQVFSYKYLLIVNCFTFNEPILCWIWSSLYVWYVWTLPSQVVCDLFASVSFCLISPPLHNFNWSVDFYGTVGWNVWEPIPNCLVCRRISWNVSKFHLSCSYFISSERINLLTYFFCQFESAIVNNSSFLIEPNANEGHKKKDRAKNKS